MAWCLLSSIQASLLPYVDLTFNNPLSAYQWPIQHSTDKQCTPKNAGTGSDPTPSRLAKGDLRNFRRSSRHEWGNDSTWRQRSARARASRHERKRCHKQPKEVNTQGGPEQTSKREQPWLINIQILMSIANRVITLFVKSGCSHIPPFRTVDLRIHLPLLTYCWAVRAVIAGKLPLSQIPIWCAHGSIRLLRWEKLMENAVHSIWGRRG